MGDGDSSRFTLRRLAGGVAGEEGEVVVEVDDLRLVYFRRVGAGEADGEGEEGGEKERSEEEEDIEKEEGEAGREPMGDKTGDGSGEESDTGDSGGSEEGDSGVVDTSEAVDELDSIRSTPVSE